MTADGMRKEHTSAAALGRLISLIRAKRFEPGDRLPSERDLAERFEMSRGVIREALSTLEAMRVIQRRPNSGIFLRNADVEASFETMVLQASLGLPLKREEISQALEVRRIMEVQAVRLACERMTAKDLKNLAKLLREAEAKIEAGQAIEMEDQAFHLAIVAGTKNDVFLRVVNAFYEISRPRRRIYFANPDQSRRSAEQHQLIFAALERRDVEESARLLDEHLLAAATQWKTILGANPTGLKAQYPEELEKV